MSAPCESRRDSVRVVCLCGSTRFRAEYAKAFYDEEHAGRICLTVPCYKDDPCCKTREEQDALDRLHLAKIRMADEILVINPGGYLGESTQREIVYATSLDKPVRFLCPWETVKSISPYGMSRGFTLVELLAVIAILALLVALLMPAISSAIESANTARDLAELNTLSQALAAFRDKHGTYPPSRIVLSETGNYSPVHFRATLPPAVAAQAIALTPRSIAALRQCWPRLQTSTLGKPVLPSPGFYDFDGNGVVSAPAILQGHECLVWFLGGVPDPSSGKPVPSGWSRNAANPFVALTSTGSRVQPFFAFDAGRLSDPDGNGYCGYADPRSIPSDPRYLAYFASYGIQYDPDDCNFGAGEGVLGAFQTTADPTGSGGVSSRPDLVASPAPNPYTETSAVPSTAGFSTHWVRSQSYQIVEAGPDRLYGPGGLWLAGQESPSQALPLDVAAVAAVTGQTPASDARRVEDDNVVSFSTGKLGR